MPVWQESTSAAGYVQTEIKCALDAADEQPEGTIFIIPFKLEECVLPNRLARWQSVGLHEPGGYERLLKALYARANKLVIPPAAPGTVPLKRSLVDATSWGLVQIGFDQKKLRQGLLSIPCCTGVLPNGMSIDIPDTLRPPADRSFAALLAGRDTLDAYLCARETGPSPVSVAFADESLSAIASIRIAELRKDADEGFAIDSAFVAPCIAIGSNRFFGEIIGRLLGQIGTVVTQVGTRRRQRTTTFANFSPSDFFQFSYLQTLSEFAPELQHFAGLGSSHPERLYVALLRFAGALSAYSLEANPLDFPGDNHADPAPGFRLLVRRLGAMMEIVIPSKCAIVPLEKSATSAWVRAAIPVERLTRESQIYLSLRAHSGTEDLLQCVQKDLKVAADPLELKRIVENALTGFPVRHVAIPPAAVPMKLGAQYFMIEFGEPGRQAIAASRTLCFFFPTAVRDSEAELLIVAE